LQEKILVVPKESVLQKNVDFQGFRPGTDHTLWTQFAAEGLFLDRDRVEYDTRVIAFYDGRVVMERDLWSALNKLFGVDADTPSPQPDDVAPVPQDKDSLAEKANQLYLEANKALKTGDWAGYGKAIDELGKVLEEMVGKKAKDS
jgi:hypothetical protein